MTSRQHAGLCLLSVVVSFAVSGCIGNFFLRQPYELRLVKNTDPVADFVRLREVFASMGGNLAAPDDDIVHWKDTQHFRLYEFKHHSVAVFPHDWNSKLLEVYIINGHVKTLAHTHDLRFSWRRTAEPGSFYINTGLTLSTNLTGSERIGLMGIFLGLSAHEIESAVTPMTNGWGSGVGYGSGAYWWNQHRAGQVYVENGTEYEIAGEGALSHSEGYFDLTYLGKHLQVIDFWRERMPLLNSDFPGPVTVVAEGEFPIPAETVHGKKEGP